MARQGGQPGRPSPDPSGWRWTLPRPRGLTEKWIAEASASFPEYARRHPEARAVSDPWEVYLAGYWLRRELAALGFSEEVLDGVALAHVRLAGRLESDGEPDPWHAAEVIFADARRSALPR